MSRTFQAFQRFPAQVPSLAEPFCCLSAPILDTAPPYHQAPACLLNSASPMVTPASPALPATQPTNTPSNMSKTTLA